MIEGYQTKDIRKYPTKDIRKPNKEGLWKVKWKRLIKKLAKVSGTVEEEA